MVSSESTLQSIFSTKNSGQRQREREVETYKKRCAFDNWAVPISHKAKITVSNKSFSYQSIVGANFWKFPVFFFSSTSHKRDTDMNNLSEGLV